jgi:DNA sulfur modification protein DndD
MVRSFNDTSTDKLSRCSDIAPMIEKDYINIRRNVINKEEYEKELKEISAEIQKMGEVNTAQIERDSNQAREMSRKKIQEKGSLLAQITNTKNNIASLSKEIEGLALKNEKNTLLRREIAYAEAIYEWFKTTYDVEEKEVKEKLSDSINRIFNQMYHGTRQVTIDDKYKVKLLTRVGDKNISTDESKGLEAVKNFAFISGLVDLARNKANDQGTPFSAEKNNLYVTEPYPIVMDAPFSNVDEIHISNIATILPNIAEQVILIVMKKDWEYAKQTMQDKVGAMYMISKVDNSDTYSKVEVSDNV